MTLLPGGLSRLARIVVPGCPHHVTQRGNRRQPVFFSDEDYAAYRGLVAAACREQGISCTAWCLMPNHVHLILTPPNAEALRGALGEAHRRYPRRINAARGWTGYLWQGRFASYPMDEAHLMAAVRYVELNPVRAGLAGRAEDWRWSSARAHVEARPDGLTDLAALAGLHRNWRAVLLLGLEARNLDPGEEATIEAHQRTGRPRAKLRSWRGSRRKRGEGWRGRSRAATRSRNRYCVPEFVSPSFRLPDPPYCPLMRGYASELQGRRCLRA